MLDHVALEVSDFTRSKAFYEAALAPIGISLLMELNDADAGFGKNTKHGPKPFFWIGAHDRPAASGAHVAFGVRTTEEVDAFHAAALAAGGTDNGAPGLRPIYHPGYYGAFILDPDGNNIEAVCHSAAAEANEPS